VRELTPTASSGRRTGSREHPTARSRPTSPRPTSGLPHVASDWAAEAFDATYFAARALKEAGSTSPAAVDEALIKEGKAGYTGVLGKATVTDGQEHSKAVLVQWENGAAVPLTNQNPDHLGVELLHGS